MTDLRDSTGVILGIGDTVCLTEEISGVHPGKLVGTVVRLRLDEKENVEVIVRLPAAKLTRLTTILHAATEALSKDIQEMKSGETPAYKGPEEKGN
jgi:hypothetical protein